METTRLTRRTLIQNAAAAATLAGAPFVRGAHAAGKLSCGFWDHWVPGANAKALGLTIPQSIFALAGEVIE